MLGSEIMDSVKLGEWTNVILELLPRLWEGIVVNAYFCNHLFSFHSVWLELHSLIVSTSVGCSFIYCIVSCPYNGCVITSLYHRTRFLESIVNKFWFNIYD